MALGRLVNSGVDVLVVGGGPGGCASAIWAARAGLKVRLLERACFPRHRPGETLHPGAGVILSQLGVTDAVAEETTMRHVGHTVSWGRHSGVHRFGADESGPWMGYQIRRERLDAILLAKARELGVQVTQPEAAIGPLVHEGRVVGVRGRKSLHARYVIDASGSRGWMRRHLGLAVRARSPSLRAHYGYCEGPIEAGAGLPSLCADHLGWTWVASIAPGQIHWTRLVFDPASTAREPPGELTGMPALGPVRGADVTWRCVPDCAGAGYFLVGDAAALLDPVSSHGVLRALMSGMMAAHAAVQVGSGAVPEGSATAQYRTWVTSWFEQDVRRLRELYAELDPVPDWIAHPPLPAANGWPYPLDRRERFDRKRLEPRETKEFASDKRTPSSIDHTSM